MSVAEFKEQAIEGNGLFVLTEIAVDDAGVEHEKVRHFQSPEGRMPLNPVDTDAHWKTTRAGKASGLQYEENVIVDLGGFILSRGVTHASERESKAVARLLEGLPLPLVSLAADTGYSDGRLRHLLEEQEIVPYIPIHPKQETSMVASGDFVYHGDHLICPQGKTLRRGSYHKWQRSYQYVARQKDCQTCPIKDTCLPPGQNRRYFGSPYITRSIRGLGSVTGLRRTDARASGVRQSWRERSSRLTTLNGRSSDCAVCGR